MKDHRCSIREIIYRSSVWPIVDPMTCRCRLYPCHQRAPRPTGNDGYRESRQYHVCLGNCQSKLNKTTDRLEVSLDLYS